MASFDEAIALVLEHEGGYVNDPDDPGGETKFGISKAMHPLENIKSLPLERAKEIYKKEYWIYDLVKDQRIANKIFDAAVNMGPAMAHRLAQGTVSYLGHKLDIDGVWGPNTESGINGCAPADFLPEFRARAAAHYCAIVINHPIKQKYLMGWLRRACE